MSALESNDGGASQFKLGVMFRLAGRHKAACTLFEKAIEGGMVEAKCHFNLAASLHECGEAARALAHYQRAFAVDPEFHEARGNAAALLLADSRPREALALCEAVLSSDAFHSVAWCNLNTALRQLGRTAEALDRSWAALSALSKGGLRRRSQSTSAAVDHPAAGAAAAAGSSGEESAAVVVCCVKWGRKYDADYVNRLHAGVSRCLSPNSPPAFVCFTEDPSSLAPSIVAAPLPSDAAAKAMTVS